MNRKKILAFIFSAIIVLSVFSGCKTGKDSNGDYTLKVATLKGPTGMGMAKLINDNTASKKYEINICSAPDEISSGLIAGKLDIASVPVNLASVIFNKTEGKYLIAAINTLGVLYILENGNTINSIQDLSGKTLYATGKASTPEYILNYILEKNELEDVKIEYKTEHSELATLMASGEVTLGMLPEPNVTATMAKNSSIRVALDLTEEWKKVSDGEAVQGCVIVSVDAITNHKEEVDKFLDEYKASVNYVNENITDAAQIIANIGIVASPSIAEKAIPSSNIVFIDGNEMNSILLPFYKVLYTAAPSSIGGVLPDEAIFYKK